MKFSIRQPSSRAARWALALIASASVFFGLDIYISPPDSAYYFGVARSLATDGDFAFSDELGDFQFPYNMAYLTDAGYIAIDWPIGAGLAWTPLYALGRAVSMLADETTRSVRPHERATVALGVLLLACAGLLLTAKLARLAGATGTQARWALAAAALGGPFVFYFYFYPLLAHLTSFAVVTAFFWGWQTTRRRRSTAQWMLLGLALGWAGAIRPQNALCVLLWIAEWSLEARQSEARVRRAWLGGLIAAGAGAFLGFAPQMIVWARLYGDPLALPKLEEMRWLSPSVFSLLFSDYHGALIWTPALALSLIGLPSLICRDRALGAGVAAVLLGQLYLNAANWVWWAGGSFSNRRLVDYTAFFAVAAAPLFAGSGWRRQLPRLWASAGIAWTLALVWAERSGAITLERHVPLSDMARGVAETVTHPRRTLPALVGDFGGLSWAWRALLLASFAALAGMAWHWRPRKMPAGWRMAAIGAGAQLAVIIFMALAAARTAPLAPGALNPPPIRHNAALWQNYYEGGYYWMTKRRFDRAAPYFETAIQIWPEFPQPYRYLGAIHMASGDLEQAEANLRRAVEISPNYQDARDLLEFVRRRAETDSAPPPPR